MPEQYVLLRIWKGSIANLNPRIVALAVGEKHEMEALRDERIADEARRKYSVDARYSILRVG